MKMSVAAIAVWAVASAGAPASGQEVLESTEAQMRGILAEAGHRHDDTASLIRAVLDHDSTVAVVATVFLSRKPSTPAVIAALRTASESTDDTVAASAFQSLQLLGASGWEEAAIARLLEMKDPLIRIDLSGILARVGRGDGWPFVKAALGPDRLGLGVALRAVVQFDGLTTADGESIDAAAELERLRAREQLNGQPAGLQRPGLLAIDVSLQQVHARREALRKNVR